MFFVIQNIYQYCYQYRYCFVNDIDVLLLDYELFLFFMLLYFLFFFFVEREEKDNYFLKLNERGGMLFVFIVFYFLLYEIQFVN